MPVKHFVVDLSLLGRGMTGVKLYALPFAQRLEQSFACRILAPKHLSSQFTNPLECADPVTFRNSIVARGRMGRAERALVTSRDTFVYCPYMHGLLGPRNQVITIHDLIAHRFPTRNPIERAFDRFLLPRLVARAAAVFTVSQTSRSEVARFYGLPVERIQVVPNGLDLTKWCPGVDTGRSPEPYLLVVSANRPYKNTTELLQHHRLWAGAYRVKIVSTRARYGSTIRAAVRTHGLEHRVDFIDDLSERELIEMYRGCAAVVYPSLMEGFGRPALEGMAVGRPVILSDIAVHKESFGAAAIFITPGNAISWEQAFRELADAATLERRIQRGLTIARGYSIENSCERLINALLTVRPELEKLRIGESSSGAGAR